MSWIVMVCVAETSCIVGGRERANDGVVAASTTSSFRSTLNGPPQLSAVASSIGISSEHSTV